MFSAQSQEVLRVTYSPQFEQLLEEKILEALKDLPSVSVDKVQIFQGRCLALQELLAQLRYAAGITEANRTTKPSK